MSSYYATCISVGRYINESESFKDKRGNNKRPFIFNFHQPLFDMLPIYKIMENALKI